MMMLEPEDLPVSQVTMNSTSDRGMLCMFTLNSRYT